jgi:hypothetical protein
MYAARYVRRLRHVTNVTNSMSENSFVMYAAGCQKVCHVMNVGSVIQKTVPCYEYMLRYDMQEDASCYECNVCCTVCQEDSSS